MMIRLFLLLALSLPGFAAPPNVLFIAVDDINDWVGCLEGHPQALTPHIDRLAARGTLFANAHCQAPICGPSRASLLSGRYPHHTGVYQQPGGPPLHKDAELFAGSLLTDTFSGYGYRTLGVGKITHGYDAKKAFQVYGGTLGGVGPKPAEDERFNYGPDLSIPFTGTQTDWAAWPETNEEMPDHKIAAWAVEQLAAQPAGSPFFLAVGFMRPHVPWYVPPQWFEPHPLASLILPDIRADDLDDVPEIGRKLHELPRYPQPDFLEADERKQLKLAVQAYLASCTFVDHQIGKVLDALDASPHVSNTVVVLFGDHGYHLGEKQRVSKHSLWEESTRVPMIVSVPGGTGGQVSRSPVGLIDLYPTLLAACGLPARASNEGLSLLPLLADPSARLREAVLTTYARKNHSLRSVDHRYIRYDDGSEELYDHRTDPMEWTNLAGDSAQRERLAEFRELLPTRNVPYHKSTNIKPVNAWFEAHFKAENVKRPSKKR